MSELHPVIDEELALLADVRNRLLRAPPPVGASEDQLRADLERIKGDIRNAKTEDKAALEQQYEHVGRLLEQVHRGKPDIEVDAESPYFAHLSIEQEGRASDVMLGRATRLDEGLRIVDWRHEIGRASCRERV